ncbi:MAG: hypothetical protein ACRD5J_16975, partial [Nitrososphaeraceae archaeon]
LAQGSVVTIAENRVFNRTCWKCGYSHTQKGSTYNTTCPNCFYKSNNPEFTKLLHAGYHLNKAFRFSGLAKDSPPIPASTSAFVPKTYNHEDIYQNSNMVAQASNSGSSGPRNNKAYKERQQSVDKLDSSRSFTYML